MEPFERRHAHIRRTAFAHRTIVKSRLSWKTDLATLLFQCFKLACAYIGHFQTTRSQIFKHKYTKHIRHETISAFSYCYELMCCIVMRKSFCPVGNLHFQMRLLLNRFITDHARFVFGRPWACQLWNASAARAGASLAMLNAFGSWPFRRRKKWTHFFRPWKKWSLFWGALFLHVKNYKH